MNGQHEADIGAEIAEREAYAWEQYDVARRKVLAELSHRVFSAPVADQLALRLELSVEFKQWDDANMPAGKRVARPDTRRNDLHLVPAWHTGPVPYWGRD